MAIDYSKLAFASTLKYMRKYEDYTLTSGGSIPHGLGYVPFFMVFAEEASTSSLIPIRTGNVYFPSGDLPFYIVEATTSSIIITEDIPPAATTNYFIRVYEDPLP